MTKLLWENRWFQILEYKGWTIYRHTGTNSGVAILPYKQVDPSTKEFLVRVEDVPPHGGLVETSITGTVEKGEEITQTLVKELKEETGYSATPDEFISLDWIYTSKGSDFILYMYAIDVTGKTQGPIEGDGSEGERGATAKWVSEEYACTKITSPSIPTMITRLNYSTNIWLNPHFF